MIEIKSIEIAGPNPRQNQGFIVTCDTPEKVVLRAFRWKIREIGDGLHLSCRYT
jgi:hypothetical protein